MPASLTGQAPPATVDTIVVVNHNVFSTDAHAAGFLARLVNALHMTTRPWVIRHTLLQLATPLESDPAPPGSAEVVRGGHRIALISPAAAIDAQGQSIAVHYRVEGDRLVMDVDDGGVTAMPRRCGYRQFDVRVR